MRQPCSISRFMRLSITTLDDMAGDPAMKRAVAFLVNVGLEKTVPVNITARESQIEAFDRRAAEAGMTRSAYMVRRRSDAVYKRGRADAARIESRNSNLTVITHANSLKRS